MPSGHTMTAFATASVLASEWPKLAPLFYVVATVVGFARVQEHAHWPGDVVVGAALGTLIGLKAYELTRRFELEVQPWALPGGAGVAVWPPVLSDGVELEVRPRRIVEGVDEERLERRAIHGAGLEGAEERLAQQVAERVAHGVEEGQGSTAASSAPRPRARRDRRRRARARRRRCGAPRAQPSRKSLRPLVERRAGARAGSPASSRRSRAPPRGSAPRRPRTRRRVASIASPTATWRTKWAASSAAWFSERLASQATCARGDVGALAGEQVLLAAAPARAA